MTDAQMEDSPFRVLIIEDSPTMRLVCLRDLEATGMHCQGCADGETGLRMLNEAVKAGEAFDGLLLDWLLPGMDGCEVLREIGADQRLDHLSVMIFTDHPDDDAYQLASQRPNNDIQLKEDLTLLPFRMRKFLTTYSDVGSMGDWRGRQLFRNRDQLGGSILFVDDSPTVCAKYGDLLRNNGYEVLIAHSMTEALEVARRDKPDLALVDYFMPGGNGDELCRALLADDRTRDVTVVMHSQRKDVIEDALNAGAIDLIWKDDPVNIFLMRTASIMRTLRAHRQAKDLDILFAATGVLDVGVMSYSSGQWQEFNDTMHRFVEECGSLECFTPDPNEPMPRRVVDHQSRRRAFNIHEVEVGDDSRVALIQDVTAMADEAEVLAKARDHAFELGNAKSQFLANMSHEIRTPLNGVIGMLELLRGSKLDDEQGRFTDTAIASAEALLSLIGDVLDFSKIDAGRLELEECAFKLPVLVEDIGQMLAGRAAEKGLELICEVEPDCPLRVKGDPGRLRQVLINLVGNALKFTSRGEVGLRLWLEHLEEDHAELGFAVSDTGIGIEPAAQKHIFEAFRQADNSTTRRFGGTGLGLAISNQLVELMGGQMRIDSQVGEGSSFQFIIRLALAGNGAVACPWRGDDVALLDGKRALIADDSANHRRYLRRLCQAWRMHSEEAEDGCRALELIERAAKSGQPIDVLLLDRIMPELGGLEMLEQLARRDDLRRPRVLLLSPMDDGDEANRARALGVDARLTKPIRRQDLLDALCGLFGAGAPRQQAKQGQQTERLDGCKVLAVEDNRVNQQVLRGILERAGAEVTLADNGADALQRLDEDGFDLILMDCEMPVLDGYAATRKLRALETEAGRLHDRQVIIALTAHTALAEREKCIAAGMDDYLSKPVRAARLIQTVKRWWQNPERVRAGILARAHLAGPAQGQGGDGDAAVGAGAQEAQPAPAAGAAGPGSSPAPGDPAADNSDAVAGAPLPATGAVAAAAPAAPAPSPKPAHAAASTSAEQTVAKPAQGGAADASDTAIGADAADIRLQRPLHEIIDQRRIDSIRDALGDIGPVLHLAIDEIPRCLERIRQALDRDQTVDARQAAHTMAGFLANLGATDAVARAREIERAVHGDARGADDTTLTALTLAANDAVAAFHLLAEQERHRLEAGGD